MLKIVVFLIGALIGLGGYYFVPMPVGLAPMGFGCGLVGVAIGLWLEERVP